MFKIPGDGLTGTARGWLGPDRLGPFIDGLRSCGRVIMALLLRESRTRYGRRSAGYVWALVSPMLLLAGLITVFTFLGRPAGAGDSIAVFFMTAIVPIYAVRSALNRNGTAIRTNRALMSYPRVNAFEVVVARTTLELVTYALVYVVFILILFTFFDTPLNMWIDRGSSLLGAFMALAFLTYGVGFLSAQIGRMFEPWNDFTGPFGRVILLTSGLFFTMGSLPEELLRIVGVNPLLHVVEWIRDATIREFVSTLYDPWYPVRAAFVFLAIGLFIDWLYRISGRDLRG